METPGDTRDDTDVNTTIVTNGTVVTGGSEPRVISEGAVAWAGDRVEAVGPAAEIRQRYADARQLDARGGLILPGFINLHHHFYSALARGLDPGIVPANFGEVLEGLWWRLDRALDSDAVRISARLTLADCIRTGCTTVFDHHASPECLGGSLDVIADEVSRAGLSAVLCYEVSDRNDHQEAIAGIEENLDFCRRHAGNPRIRGTMGLHASFTVTDETLESVARQRPDGSGCHLHVAEDFLDIRVSRALFGANPIERLERHGLLDERALLAHGVHLADDEMELVGGAGAVLIHNPESNANNGVGRLNPVEASRRGCLVGLGTDGMASSMLRAVRAAFLGHRTALRDPRVGFELHPLLLHHNAVAARRFFDEPLLGELSPGAPADIAVMDAPSPTPIDGDNLFGHLVYGAAEAPARHTVARGRVVMEDFRMSTVDLDETAREAQSIAVEVWRRFHARPAPTSS
jgi:putative selenium metabolism protein SsnA